MRSNLNPNDQWMRFIHFLSEITHLVTQKSQNPFSLLLAFSFYFYLILQKSEVQASAEGHEKKPKEY